jgi:hypothetical protein
MAIQRYTVYAYSPSLNQSVRRFDLANVHNNDVSYEQAMIDATNFAQLQNSQQYMKTSDWLARVEEEQLGYDTMPNFLYAR